MEPSPLEPLFACRRTLRAVVDSVLEGRLGTAVADDPRSPRVARLELGCYAIFGGDPSLPAARELAQQVAAPREAAAGGAARLPAVAGLRDPLPRLLVEAKRIDSR